MSGESYTRWRSSMSDEDDDDFGEELTMSGGGDGRDPTGGGGGGDHQPKSAPVEEGVQSPLGGGGGGGGGGGERSLNGRGGGARPSGGGAQGGQGGGRVTITSPRYQASIEPSKSFAAKISCVLILVCLITLCIGVILGYEAHKVPRPEELELAASVEKALKTPFTVSQEELLNVTSNFKRFFTSDMIIGYSKLLSSTPREKRADYISSRWNDLGYFVFNTTFNVSVATASTNEPNTIEVFYKDGRRHVANEVPEELSEYLPYNAYSASGGVSGMLVYAHYGTKEDLQTLQANSIGIEGRILIIRIGKLHRGVKIQNVERAGAVGVILYPDPEDFEGPGNGGDPYPDGLGLPKDGFLWGNLKTKPGNPSTNHVPAIENVYRSPVSEWPIPNIPVQTVNQEAALRLMGLLGGPVAPETWSGKLKLRYRLGGNWAEDNINNVSLNVHNIIQNVKITNIHATLPAVDTTKTVMIGCHYDYWYSGGSDPDTGLASMMAMSEAVALGMPGGTYRQLMFNAWDAEEFGIIGSAEFNKLYSSWIEQSVMAYLNTDQALLGTGSLKILASPALREAIRFAAKDILWPEGDAHNVFNASNMGEMGSEEMGREPFSNPGSGSDFVSFTAQHGVPSAHFMAMGINGSDQYSLYHSQYDAASTVQEKVDPDSKWIIMVASLLGSTALALTESARPPVRFTDVSTDLIGGWKKFMAEHKDSLKSSRYVFTDITNAIEEELRVLHDLLEDFDASNPDARTHLPPYLRSKYFDRQVQQFLSLDRHFLSPRGVSRNFTSHLMTGPDPNDIYKAKYFPHAAQSIIDALVGRSGWSKVHEELSYILASLVSLRQFSDFGRFSALHPSGNGFDIEIQS
ncbi:N-acetylated-alpha-linked acidic dipeptidase 2-like isoform X2 [Oratosquilla oratoria]